MADLTESNACQKLAVLLPSALTTPVPVMTTRCMLFDGRWGTLRLDEKSNTLNHLVNVFYLFRLFVIDLDLELALEIEENVQTIERVDIEGLETTVRLHRLEGNTLGGRDDFQNPLLDGLIQCLVT